MKMAFLFLRILPVAFLAGPLLAASGGGRDAFLRKKREIAVLTAERMRAAPSDHQRALKTGEDRLRRLHEEYKVAGSTPPTTLDGDVRELQVAGNAVRLRKSRGQAAPPDPEAARLIDEYAESYRAAYRALLDAVAAGRREGTPEGRLYWESLREFGRLRRDAAEEMVHNAPTGERSLDGLLSRDEWRLLKALEGPEAGGRSRAKCVMAPGEHLRNVVVDAGPFYQSQGLLPGVNPLRVYAFRVPAGCRTVVQRESGAKLVVRVSAGQGTAHVGSMDHSFSYAYLAIPSDTPYFFTNTGHEYLDMECVLLPQ